MTTLVTWLGVDSRGAASLYLASDSRFTWQQSETWDFGQKLFTARRHPEVLGYCGDVLFSSQVLGQAVQLIEMGVLFPPMSTPDERFNAIERFVRESFATYPPAQQRAFTLVYGTRDGSGMAAEFFLATVEWKPGSGWCTATVACPAYSDVLLALGSGERFFRGHYARWKRSEVGRTSRAVFSAFCDMLSDGKDFATGGAPQLVGLYREGSAVTYGLIYRGERWLSGSRVPDSGALSEPEWRDHLFQRCDGITMQALKGAQRHARPKSL